MDRRGGGLLFTGRARRARRRRLSRRRRWRTWFRRKLPASKGTFHRDFTGRGTDAAGRAERHLPAGRRPGRAMPSAGRRCRRWPTTRKWANPNPAPPCCWSPRPQGKAPMPLLVTENYGRGRTALFATAGSWRWKMWLDHADQTHATFWQQIAALPGDRYAGPGDRAPRPSRCCPTTPACRMRVEVRDKEYKPVTNAKVQARFIGPDGTTRHHGTDAAAARRGRLHAASGRRRSRARTWPKSSPAASRKNWAATC